jgi:uncharacterized oxidoreductase
MKTGDNTILISGGGSGIGRALAEMFHSKGNKVIIAGRRQEKLDEVTNANPGIESLILDINSPNSIRDLTDKMNSNYPELNVVIHNAGMMKSEKIGYDDVATAEETISTNLTGQIRLNSALVPLVKKHANAAIITVSSGLAFLPRADFPTYCATKAAIHSYTQSLRTQLLEDGVKVIELEPPYVQTELQGPEQSADPKAMPLDEFISEVTNIIETKPEVKEVQVERVKFQRTAESSGEYEQRYTEFNARFGIKTS